jgi:ABC-type polar amino acid transport system ATPase subunit
MVSLLSASQRQSAESSAAVTGGAHGPAAATVVEFDDVCKAFDDCLVLDHVSFSVQRGEVVAVCGRSGSGKSTLLRCICRFEELDGGDIMINGRSLRATRDIRRLRQDIGMVFQQLALYPHMTAEENIILAPMKVKGMPKAEARKAAMALLERVGIAEKAAAYPSQLSGGQQQRVAIARALAMNPSVLLLDEATSALDPEMTAEVLEVVADLAREGMTMLIVTHELEFARRVADRMVFMEAGRVLWMGTPGAFFSGTAHPRVTQFLEKLRPASAG